MDVEDITECLVNLFLENEFNYNIKALYTAKHNQALIINNFVYHIKTLKEANDKKDASRWVCNVKNCSASVSFLGDNIVKINGKKVEPIFIPQASTARRNRS